MKKRALDKLPLFLYADYLRLLRHSETILLVAIAEGVALGIIIYILVVVR